MKPESMDSVFHALASQPRRAMLDIVQANPGSSVLEVAGHFDVSRIAVMKHLNVLEQAGLIISQKTGRVRRLYFNATPIQMIHERWTTDYSAHWAGRLSKFKHDIEASLEPGTQPRRQAKK
jgi:DNA-binding transcriptional ArsR family regulator